MSGARPGWYPDPYGDAPARWWDGSRWTPWCSDGARQWQSAHATQSPRHTPADLPALDYVRGRFLAEVRRRGVLDEPQITALGHLADELAARTVATGADTVPTAAATAAPTADAATAPSAAPPMFASPAGHPGEPPGAPPVVRPPAPAPAPAPTAHPAPAPAAARPPQPTFAPAPAGVGPVPHTPPPRRPSRLARWWATSRLRLDTDLTVHGLTYLGVLLLFVGVFGLVAFAFGDVEPWLRPVAELAVAVVPFAAAGLLARSGARFVARAMVAVGGLILPVMVLTSFADGYPIPPDLHGTALPIGAAASCTVIAAGYAVWVRRRPASALRVMWAPVLWLAAGMAAVGVARPMPRGEDVAVPSAAQVAVIALAVLATTWWSRSRTSSLAVGGLAAAPAGSVVIGALAVVASAAEGWPVLPVIVTVVALAVVAQWLPRLGRRTVLAVAWVGVVLRVLLITDRTPMLSEHVTVDLDLRAPLLLVVLLLGAGLLELMTRAPAPAPSVPGSAPGDPAGSAEEGRPADLPWAPAVVAWALAAFVLVAAPIGGWWVVAAAVALTAWAMLRRRVVHLTGLDAVAAVAPVAVVIGVWQWDGVVAGGLLAALAVAVIPLARGWMRSSPTDRLWFGWWCAAVPAVALAATALLGEPVVPVMTLLAAAALVLGPAPRTVSVPVATPLLWFVWATTVPFLAGRHLAVGYAVLGLGAVLGAHLAGRRASAPAPAPAPASAPSTGPRTPVLVAVAGYLTGTLAVLISIGDTPALAVGLGATAVSWLIAAQAGDRSPVVRFVPRPMSWALTLLLAPATVVAALHATDTVLAGHPWWTAPALVAALGYAAMTRLARPAPRAALPWCALVLGWFAVLGSLPLTPDHWAPVAGLAVLVAVAPLTRHHRALTWVSWGTVAPLAGAAAWAAGMNDARVPVATLLGGGVVAAGALLVDRSPTPRALPHPRLHPPFVVGLAQFAAGLVAALAVADDALVLAAAAVLAVLAALSRIGGVGAVAALAAWWGTRTSDVWFDVAAAAILLLAALVVSFRRTGPRWARWDVPFAVAAIVPAATALGTAAVGAPDRSWVYLAVGSLVLGASARTFRSRELSDALSVLGSVLVLVGAVWAGPFPTSAALLALAVGHSALAVLRPDPIRRWSGAVLAAAAWLVLLGEPLDWAPQVQADVTAMGGAMIVVAIVSALTAGHLARSWADPWAVVTTTVAVGAALTGLAGTELEPSWAHALTWVLIAVAAGLVGATRPLPVLVRAAPVLVIAAALTGLAAASAPDLVRVLALGAIAVAAAVGSLVTVRSTVDTRPAGIGGSARTGSSVIDPAVAPILGVGASVCALGFALSSEHLPLVAIVLAVAAVQAGAHGIALRSLPLRSAAPLLAWVAWVAYAVDAVGGVAAWYTIPVGVALIAVVEVWRADRRSRGVPPSDPGVAALDLAGIGFLVIASFVASFTVSVLHALIAACLGVLVFVWAVITRVRRRLLAGAAVVLLGTVIAVVLPLVAIVPAWGSAAVWVAVAVVGLLAVLAATLLERGRAVIRTGRSRMRAATTGWE